MSEDAFRPLVLDGAMGTELLRRGYDTRLPLWSAGPLLAAPEVVTGIHEEYVRAGADVITADTFRTNARAFRRAGLTEEDAREATHRAVACARAALERVPERSALVAGSLAPAEDCYRPELVPPDAELAREHGRLARWLVDAGVDVVLVETMNTVREARIAVAAAAALGVPVWASFVTGPDPEQLLSGESLVEAARAALAAGADLIGINCVRHSVLTAGLRRLADAIGAPMIAYANGGRVSEHGGAWHFDPSLNADEYAVAAVAWTTLGARVVGGCCGTGPQVTTALRRGVDKHAGAAYDRAQEPR